MSPRRPTREEMWLQPWNSLHLQPRAVYEPLWITIHLSGGAGRIRLTGPSAPGYQTALFGVRDLEIYDMLPAPETPHRTLQLSNSEWAYVDLWAHSWLEDEYPIINLRIHPEDTTP